MGHMNRRGQWVRDENDGYLDQKARQVGGGMAGVWIVFFLLLFLAGIGEGVVALFNAVFG